MLQLYIYISPSFMYMYSERPCTWNKSPKPFISFSVIVTCIISFESEKGVCVTFYFSQ